MARSAEAPAPADPTASVREDGSPDGLPSPRRREPWTRRETVVVRLCLTAIALAVLDDAFLHPEQGTSAGDHLAGGVVPSALALTLVILLPRLRAGARAALTLMCGVLALTAGIADGVRHVAVDRLSGDDATAMLATAAGALLVVIGISTLWRSRRLDGRWAPRYARRAAIAVLGLVAALYVVVPAAIAIIATHRARVPVEPAALGRPYESLSLTTQDGLRLSGWYVPSRNRAAVLAFPGRSGPVRHARMLVRHGYGVLLLDRRGEGRSDGDANAYGWEGDRDVRAAVAWLQRRSDVDRARIGGLGLSVGGEMLLEAAARTRGLRAVVSEGAGARSLAEQLDTPGRGRVERWISPWVVQTAALSVLANASPPESLVDLLPRIAPRPVLLIRALVGNDDEVLNRAYAASGPSARLWELPRGGHTGGLSAMPREYERRVVGFFDAALRPR